MTDVQVSQKSEGVQSKEDEDAKYRVLEGRLEVQEYRRFEKRTGPIIAEIIPKLAELIREGGKKISDARWDNPDIFNEEQACGEVIRGLVSMLWQCQLGSVDV